MKTIITYKKDGSRLMVDAQDVYNCLACKSRAEVRIELYTMIRQQNPIKFEDRSKNK